MLHNNALVNTITKTTLLDSKFFNTTLYKEYSITIIIDLAQYKKYNRLFNNLHKLTKDVYQMDQCVIPLCFNFQDGKLRCVPRYMIPDILKPWIDKYDLYFSIQTSIINSDKLMLELSAWSIHLKKKPYIYKYLYNFLFCYLSFLKTDKTNKFEDFLKEYSFLEHKCHKRFLQKTILI